MLRLERGCVVNGQMTKASINEVQTPRFPLPNGLPPAKRVRTLLLLPHQNLQARARHRGERGNLLGRGRASHPWPWRAAGTLNTIASSGKHVKNLQRKVALGHALRAGGMARKELQVGERRLYAHQGVYHFPLSLVVRSFVRSFCLQIFSDSLTACRAFHSFSAAQKHHPREAPSYSTLHHP